MTEQEKSLPLAELAALIGAELDGDPAFRVRRPASLARATGSDVSFFSDHRLASTLESTRAGAVILGRPDRELFAGHRLLADDPYRAFVQASRVLLGRVGPSAGEIAPSAVIDPGARTGSGVSIGPLAVIGSGVDIADDVSIGAGTVVGAGTRIGTGTRIAAGVVIYDDCTIGRRCHIESGVVIGAPGFGYLPSPDGWIGVPQIGSVVIGDDVDIGANTTIDRGALDDTIIEDGVKMDNLIQIGHNVVIGAHTAIAACTGIAGSARIGKRCRIGGRSSIAGHLEIADEVTIHATSMVIRSVREKGSTYSSNLSAMPVAKWRRILVRLAGIDELYSRVRDLERARAAGSGRDDD